MYTLEEADAICAYLQEQGLNARLDSSKVNFDITFAHNQNHTYYVQLPKEAFSQGRAVLEKYYVSNIDDNALQAHFFSEYSNQELNEIVEQPAEWNAYDYNIAVQLLHTRGISYSQEELGLFYSDSQAEYYAPKRIKFKLLWTLGMLVFPMIGVIAATVVLLDKRIDDQGQKRFTYDQQSRSMSSFVLVLCILLIGFFFFSNMANKLLALVVEGYETAYLQSLLICCICI